MTIYRRLWKTASGAVRRAWIVEWYIDGRRFRRQFKTQSEAAAFAESPDTKRMNSGAQARPLTFSAVTAAYVLEQKSRGLERSTYDSYQRQIQRHIEPKIGSLMIRDVDRMKGLEILDELKSQLTPRYAKVVFSTFKRIMNYAHNVGAIEQNPLTNLRYSASRDSGSIRRYERAKVPSKLLISDLRERIEWGDEINWDYIRRADVVAVLGLFAGLRPSGIRGLKIRNVVSIDNSYYVQIRQRADIFNMIGDVKTPAALRDVPISNRVYTMLQTYIQQQAMPNDGLLLRSRGSDTPIDYSNFVARDWKRFSESSLLKLPPELKKFHDDNWDKLDIAGWQEFGVKDFIEFRIKFGKPAITLHGLRHAYASLEIERGVTPKVLQQRMGHSSYLTTTDLYGHLWKDRTQDKKDAEALDAKVTEIGEMRDLDLDEV